MSIIGSAACAGSSGSAGSAPAATAAPAERKYLLERVDDAAVVQLYADGFAELPLKEKTLVWHLYQAALAGRDYTDVSGTLTFPPGLASQTVVVQTLDEGHADDRTEASSVVREPLRAGRAAARLRELGRRAGR